MSDKEKNVKITKAKGRPMLTWVGKRPLTQVRAYPAQLVESFNVPSPVHEEGWIGNDEAWSDWPDAYPRGGLLFHGDNKDVLAHLLANGFRGKVKLIYIDPPFDSGADYVRKVQLRGAKGSTKIDGEEYTLGEQIQYEDIWANDNYLQFMYERLLLLRELLCEDGSIFVHCDWRRNHHLRSILDEIFGQENFINEVVWKRTTAHGDAKQGARRFDNVHDTILFYSKSKNFTWNIQYIPFGNDQIEQQYNKQDEDGRRYRLVTPTAAKRGGDTSYEFHGVTPPAGRFWAYTKDKMEEMYSQGKIYFSSTGQPYIKYFLDDRPGVAASSLWLEIPILSPTANERLDYPTQKPEALVERMVLSTTNHDDLVLDCFQGSGTTLAAAQKNSRRWIGCDINKGAIQTAAKRLYKIMQDQAEKMVGGKQGELDVSLEKERAAVPAQFSFTAWRVNDYDLQIQHNEAVQLACDHIGITRSRADGYFDGSLGGKLVKIVPFNHPLTPLDLEDLKREINTRPEEERDIVMVCLGLELNARAWIEEYNRIKPINRIGIIELRTDPKYGGFFKHDPLIVSLSIKRKKEKLIVEVNDVFSPSILQRLNLEQGVFRAQIDDWRAVVDCIMIDTDYDGEVFNVALSDIPARKQDLVEGSYELPVPPDGATVAVKVIDMLGEEAIITQQV